MEVQPHFLDCSKFFTMSPVKTECLGDWVPGEIGSEVSTGG